jgi:hypothetical protein
VTILDEQAAAGVVATRRLDRRTGDRIATDRHALLTATQQQPGGMAALVGTPPLPRLPQTGS